MNNYKLFFSLFALIAFSSCEKNIDSVNSDIAAELSEEQIKELIVETNADWENSLFTQFNSDDYLISNNATDNKPDALETLKNEVNLSPVRLKSAMGPIVYGPYTTSMPATKTLSNYKMVVSGQPGLATGVYFCDVYQYKANISLPANSIGYPNSVTPQGVSNFSNQTLGYTYYTASGTTVMSVVSYKIYVRTNIIGQVVNKTFPSNLNNVNSITLSYSYITL
jgi:hypothetical protein